MEKNLCWFQNSRQQSPNAIVLGGLLDPGQQNVARAYMKAPYCNGISPKRCLSSYADIGLPQFRANEPDGTGNQLYHLPCQDFPSDLDPILNKKPFKGTVQGNPNAGTRYAQKQFLVFDQSGGQTTLICSSGIGTPLSFPNSWNPKPSASRNWLKEEPGVDREAKSPLWSFLNDRYIDEGNQKDEVESEMQEDSEELNALLYSDDDSDYFEDDEETSTGHSPSTMTSHGIPDSAEGKGEEAKCSNESTKRQKLLGGSYDVPSPADATVMDTASSLKCFASCEIEDGAESCCGNGPDESPRKFSSLSGKKRSRKEHIRETVRILESLIPDGKGKDTVDIIDEAIHYLRSLKAKAEVLGLDTLAF